MANQFEDRDIAAFFQGIQRQSDFIQQVLAFEQVNRMTGAVSRLEKEQKKIRRDLALQPMRSHNFSGEPTSALMGPNGPIDLDGRMLTIETAWHIPESDVDALADHLHLPPFEKDTPLDKKRERLQKYLGIIAGFEDEDPVDDEDDEDELENLNLNLNLNDSRDDPEGGFGDERVQVEDGEYGDDDDDDWSDQRLD